MTDFFDDDLVKRREGTPEIKFGPTRGGGKEVEPGSSELVGKPLTDLNLTRMARHKEQVEEQVATSMKELERLRQRQEDLERQKRDLESIRKKQSDYEAGRQEMLDRLRKSLGTMERDELRHDQASALLQATRVEFKQRLAEIEELNAEQWNEREIRDELNNALSVIESARADYNKAIARIEALTSGGDKSGSEGSRPVIFEDHYGSSSSSDERSLTQWLSIGFFVSLPMIVTIVVVTLFYLHTVGIL